MKFLVFSFLAHAFVIIIGSSFFQAKQQVSDLSLPKLLNIEFSQSLEKISLKNNVNALKKKAKVSIRKQSVIKNINSITKARAVNVLETDYANELKYYLEKSQRYPIQAIKLSQSGVVEVRVQIDSAGNFSSVHLSKSSTFKILDLAAIRLLKKIGRFKPLPKSISPNSIFTIPLAYVIKGIR